MMRALLRISLLALVLGAYAVQPMTSQQHLHEGGERTHCVACLSQASPEIGAASQGLALELAPPSSEVALPRRSQPPPPQLEPCDVSFCTSPPAI